VGSCSAQRQVTVQPGPLIRTEGSHITIWCNVTGYKEGVEQDFEWSMYLYTAPDREIRIVSTSQHSYAYALYAQRVNSKEIYIERLSGDSVVLHITKLQAADQGMYECYTPNTDSRYLGSYSARTNLTGEPPPNSHLTLIYNIVCFQQHCFCIHKPYSDRTGFPAGDWVNACFTDVLVILVSSKRKLPTVFKITRGSYEKSNSFGIAMSGICEILLYKFFFFSYTTSHLF
ncbi:hypothetical protein PO909_033539, partial [Leuciscus waleckii]